MKSTTQRIVLALLAAISFTHILDFVIMMPLGPQLIRHFAIDPSQYGLIVSSYTYSAGIFGLLGAFLLDQYDRKRALCLLYVGFLIGTISCGIAPTVPLLVLARIVAGGFGGMLSALVFSIIGDVFPESQRGRATGIVMSSFSVASVIGVPIGLTVAQRFGWHFPFFGIGVLGTLLLGATLLGMPTLNSHLNRGMVKKESFFTVIFHTIRTPNELWAILLNVLLVFSGFSLIPYISTYLVSNVGLPEGKLFLVYLIGGALTFFTSPVIGRLSDRFGKRRVFTGVALLAILPIVGLPVMGRLPLLPMLVVTTLFFIFVSGRFIPAMALITSSVSPARRGSFLSIATAAQQLGSGAGAAFAGAIIVQDHFGLLHHYGIVGIISALVTIIAVLVGRKVKIYNDGHPHSVVTR